MLASYLAQEVGGQWQRIIDDTLPVRFDEAGSLLAMVHFPQLKVPAEHQPVHLVPETTALQAVYVLKPHDPALGQEVTTHQLSDSQATMALIQHTVGSRLFSADLPADHLALCSRLAAVVPVRVLAFPKDITALPAIGTLLQSDLKQMLRHP